MNLATLRCVGWISRYGARLTVGIFVLTLVAWAIAALLLVTGCGRQVEAQPQTPKHWPIASSSQAQEDLAVWLNRHGDVRQINIVGLSQATIDVLPVAKTEIANQRHPRFGVVYNEDDTTSAIPTWCSWNGRPWQPCGMGDGARRVHWNAGEMDTAAPCSYVTEQINSGPRITSITCSVDTDAIVDAEVDLPNDSTSIDLRSKMFSVANDTDGIASIEVTCMCRGDGDVIDNNYGSTESDLVTFAPGDQYEKKEFVVEDIVCDSTCDANDTIHIQMTLNVEETFTGIEDLRWENMSIIY